MRRKTRNSTYESADERENNHVDFYERNCLQNRTSIISWSGMELSEKIAHQPKASTERKMHQFQLQPIQS